jgi:hypothetical protein
MMLWTDPLLPASWWAMLPQKFSAATIWTPAVRASEAQPAHPVANASAASGAANAASLAMIRDPNLGTRKPYQRWD